MSKHRSAPAYWRIDETCIAEFDTVEEAERALAASPKIFEISLGDKTLEVNVDDVHVYQNADEWTPF